MGQRLLSNKVARLLLISIISNLIMTVLGVIIALRTNSSGLLADAMDSLADVLISTIVFTGFFISLRKTDEKVDRFKLEVLIAFTVAILTIILAAYLVYHSYIQLLSQHTLREVELGFFVALSFGFVSLVITFYKYTYAKKYELLSLKADAINSVKDTSSSFIAAAGVLLSSTYSPIFDIGAALIIAGFIASASIPVIRESALILIDVYKDPLLKGKLEEFIKEIPYITKILSVNFRRLGYKVAIEVEVEVDKDITVEEFHEYTKLIENKIKQKFINVAKVLITIKSIS